MPRTPFSDTPHRVRDGYNEFKARGLELNLTRGKPASAQLELSGPLLALPGLDVYLAED
jgi:hypothetical protein